MATPRTFHNTPTQSGPTFWHHTITCFEPITNVTGGIGTYTELIAGILQRNPDCNTLLLCGSHPGPFFQNTVPGLTIRTVEPRAVIDGLNVNWIGDDHLRYSFNVANTLMEMQKRGDKFGVIEFPDYKAEGLFTIKAVRQGFIHCDNAAIRLHSPETMLFEDNNVELDRYSTHQRQIVMCEMYCLRHCDTVLYGADAMLDRVNEICATFGFDIVAKAKKIFHPYPQTPSVDNKYKGSFRVRREGKDENPAGKKTTNIFYIGRLEPRKGIVDFIEYISANKNISNLIKEKNIVMHLFGRDLVHDNGMQSSQVIKCAAESGGLGSSVEVHHHVAKHTLNSLAAADADGFVFPSRFENFPNALLETLQYSKPTLASSKGGMPEIASAFPHVRLFDPTSPENEVDIISFLRDVVSNRPGQVTNYADVANLINSTIAQKYAELNSASGQRSITRAQFECDSSVGFVITYYNDGEYVRDAIRSARQCMNKNDKIIVVDDCSNAEQRSILTEVSRELHVDILRTSNNGGPSVARNLGAGRVECDYIQFLDADDLLDQDGFNSVRAVLDRLPNLDMAYGACRAFGENNYVWMPRDSNILNVLDENFSHSAVLIRKNAYDKIGGYCEEMRWHFEDWEFNVRFAMAGMKSEVVPLVSLYYRIKDKSRTNSNERRIASSKSTLVRRSLFNLKRASGLSGAGSQQEILKALAIYYSAASDRARSVGNVGGEVVFSDEVGNTAGFAHLLRRLKREIRRSDLGLITKGVASRFISLAAGIIVVSDFIGRIMETRYRR